MALNRTITPPTEALKEIRFPEGQQIMTPNNIPVYFVSSDIDEVLRVEFIFDAGTKHQTQNCIAAATNALLVEGTSKHTSSEIADGLDFYGSYFQPRCVIEDSQLTLYCLKKHLSSCLSFVYEVLTDAVFPEKEIAIYKQNSKQKLMVQKEKTSFLARREFYKIIFGKENPYGNFSESIDYDNISRETLLNYYQNFYQNKISYVLLSGAVDQLVIDQTINFLQGFTRSKKEDKVFDFGDVTPGKYLVHKPDSAQATIRIGKRMFDRKHPDFRKLQLLNLVLGGYFGSRLMKNIREEKGLTYGIYSVLESYKYTGNFYIEADVNKDLVETATTEIYKEIDLLCNEKIGAEELETAKNYLLGSFLRSVDGPFSLADRYKILIDNNLTYSFYHSFSNDIMSTTAEEMIDMANKYLTRDSLVEVISGDKK